MKASTAALALIVVHGGCHYSSTLSCQELPSDAEAELRDRLRPVAGEVILQGLAGGTTLLRRKMLDVGPENPSRPVPLQFLQVGARAWKFLRRE